VPRPCYPPHHASPLTTMSAHPRHLLVLPILGTSPCPSPARSPSLPTAPVPPYLFPAVQSPARDTPLPCTCLILLGYYALIEAERIYPKRHQRICRTSNARCWLRGLINLANLLAGVFIVGLSLTEKSIAASVPVIGIAAVAGLYAISYVIPAHHTEGNEVNQVGNQS
jgi:hypothetical protein